MGLKIHSDVPHGNVRSTVVRQGEDPPEVQFAASPGGSAEALWFCFRLTDKTPPEPVPQKVRLTLKHGETLSGVRSPLELLPVYRPADQGWHRVSTGVLALAPDGRADVSWLVPYPSPSLDVAFCFPYGKSELRSVLDKSKGYWHEDELGMSQAGRPMSRLANDYGAAGGNRHGLYLVARQRAGETPASWVLDGALQYFSKGRKDPFLVWCVPFADVDGVAYGRHAGDAAMPLDVAWGAPPRRHECQVIQQDIARWSARCRPEAVIDFQAAAAGESDGVYCVQPSLEPGDELYKAADKWANVLRQELGTSLAASAFKRDADGGCGGQGVAGGMSLSRYAACVAGVCPITIRIPYAKIGTTVLTQKIYRDIGERIARALVKR